MEMSDMVFFSPWSMEMGMDIKTAEDMEMVY